MQMNDGQKTRGSLGEAAREGERAREKLNMQIIFGTRYTIARQNSTLIYRFFIMRLSLLLCFCLLGHKLSILASRELLIFTKLFAQKLMKTLTALSAAN